MPLWQLGSFLVCTVAFTSGFHGEADDASAGVTGFEKMSCTGNCHIQPPFTGIWSFFSLIWHVNCKSFLLLWHSLGFGGEASSEELLDGGVGTCNTRRNTPVYVMASIWECKHWAYTHLLLLQEIVRKSTSDYDVENMTMDLLNRTLQEWTEKDGKHKNQVFWETKTTYDAVYC